MRNDRIRDTLVTGNWSRQPRRLSNGDARSGIGGRLESHELSAIRQAPPEKDDEEANMESPRPNTGMWWRNDLAQVAENLKWWRSPPPAPTGPEDLLVQGRRTTCRMASETPQRAGDAHRCAHLRHAQLAAGLLLRRQRVPPLHRLTDKQPAKRGVMRTAVRICAMRSFAAA
jgi:hypothetical protein